MKETNEVAPEPTKRSEVPPDDEPPPPYSYQAPPTGMLALNGLILAKLFNLNFYKTEVVSRRRDPQRRAGDSCLDLTKWRLKMFKFLLIYGTFYL